MFITLVRRFSRLAPVKTRTGNLENVISITNDVKFRSRTNAQAASDPYDRESREIERVFTDKFIRKGRRRVDSAEPTTFNRFSLDDSGSSQAASLGSVSDAPGPKQTHPSNEPSSYDFKVEPDEFHRFEDYESLKRNPRYQDLTHEERQYLQEIEAKARLNDPFNSLRTNRAKIDPVRDAKRLLRDIADEPPEEHESQIELIGETEETELLDRRLVEQNKFDEVVARIRNKIRIEKKEKSEINHLRIPNVNGIVLDPIKRHVLRRAARIGTMLHTHIEQLFTCNKPEFLHRHLNGAAITINHVEMPTSKSTVRCFYKILSKHDPAQVQRDLDLAAPKVRFMIARKLELGYTPPVKFIKYDRADFINARKRSQMLEHAFNLPLELGRNRAPSNGGCENRAGDDDEIVINDDQITPEMNREIQESFHRRYCGYP